MVSISLYHLVDTFWVAKLGYQAIAALTITFPYFIVIIAVGIGTGIGANALASRRFGERNVEATNQVAGQVFLLTALIGAIFVVVAAVFARPLLMFIGATPDILDMATQYLVIFSWGTPFILFRLMTRNIFQASGDAIKPMIFTIVGTSINVILDPFLIFGWGPFPEMGVGGAALATVIASLLSAGLGFYYVVAHKSVYRLKLHHFRPRLSVVADIYRVGLPSVLMDMTESVVFALFNYVLSRFGSVALAAVGIAMRVSDLAFMPIIGMAQGLLPIVGFSLGARLWGRLWGAVRLASLGLAVMLGIATVVLEIFTPQAIAIFNNDPELLEIAIPCMRIFMSTLILIGPSIMFITTFQGLSKGKTAMVLSLTRQFIFFVPPLFILPRFMDLNGAWLSIPISDGMGAIISGIWLYREYKLQQRSGMWDAGPADGVEQVG
jgi:putative MATE family efflux protein